MEAIKCPNCGSEKVKELTEEKYVCLGCDNIFLVHNLSKEFRQTDEHIADVHEDISKKIDVLSKSVASVSVNFDANNVRAKEVLVEAEDNLIKNRFSDAYVSFKKYVSFVPNSCVGYLGMYRVVSNMNKIKEEKDFYNGFDILKKALECEDCNREEVLEPIRNKYQEYVDTIFYNDLNEAVRMSCEEKNIQQKDTETDIQQLIEFYEKQKETIEKQLEGGEQRTKEQMEKYNALTETEKKKKLQKALIPPIVVFVLALILLGGVWKILAIIISVIWMIFAVALSSRPGEWSEDDPFVMQKRKEIDVQRNQADYWRNTLEVLNSHNSVQISDIEKMICDEYSKGKTADEIYAKFRGNKDYIEMGVNNANSLMLTEVGASPVAVIRVVREITGLGLSEAKNLVDSAPAVILKDADYSVMVKAKTLLEAEGAKATLI